MVMAMRSTFHGEAARGLHASYEMRFGDIVIHACVDDDNVEVAAGPSPAPDLIIEAGPAIKVLMSGDISAAEAIANGVVRLTGDPQLLTRFAEIFRIEPMPESIPVLN